MVLPNHDVLLGGEKKAFYWWSTTLEFLFSSFSILALKRQLRVSRESGVASFTNIYLDKSITHSSSFLGTEYLPQGWVVRNGFNRWTCPVSWPMRDTEVSLLSQLSRKWYWAWICLRKAGLFALEQRHCVIHEHQALSFSLSFLVERGNPLFLFCIIFNPK